MCLLDGGTHYHREAHRILQYNIQGNGFFIRELKYEVVYATKVVGEHSHPTLPVGGLTNNANKMEFTFADDCQKGSKGTTNVA